MTLQSFGLYGQLGQLTIPRGAAVSNWWLSGGISAGDCIAAYQAKGAASQAASYVNLANPGTYNATPSVIPGWSSADGWQSPGALNTGYRPNTGNTFSVLARFEWDGATKGVAVGVTHTDSNDTSIWPEFILFDMALGFYGGYYRSYTPITGDHTVILTSTGLWLDGSRVGTAYTGSIAASGVDIFLMARGRSSGYDNPMGGYFKAAALYNTNLESYVTSLTAAVAAL